MADEPSDEELQTEANEAAGRLAARQLEEQAEEDARVAEQAAAVAARKADPGAYVGLDAFGSGSYAYQAAPGRPLQREIRVDGQPYHHVDTDGDGVWLYRRGA